MDQCATVRRPDSKRLGAPTAAPTAWEHVGGVAGLVQSAIPSTVFVGAHSMLGTTSALVLALAAAVVVLVVRGLRRLTMRPAIGGVVGVVVSSVIVYRTGDARDYFLPDIWGYSIGAAITALSVVVRWPLAGVVWSALNGTVPDWRGNRRALIGYSIATATAAATFTIRALTQIWFYRHDQADVMVLMRLVVNYPLWAITLLTWAWSIRRAGWTG